MCEDDIIAQDLTVLGLWATIVCTHFLHESIKKTILQLQTIYKSDSIPEKAEKSMKIRLFKYFLTTFLHFFLHSTLILQTVWKF